MPTVWSEAKDAERSRGQLKMTPDRHKVSFARATAGRPSTVSFLILFCCVKMVLIDRASRELSIGCHIVHFDYFDLQCGILGSELDFELSAAFLPRF